MKIKICGLKTPEEALYLNENKVEYAGMVLYFKKSHRNIDINTARTIIEALDKNIKKVAVTVCPDTNQINEIAMSGFDYIQIHGNVDAQLVRSSKIPVILAINVPESETDAISLFSDFIDKYILFDNVYGFLFDASSPGSGKGFNLKFLKSSMSEKYISMLRNKSKLIFLAGGLNPSNVKQAISDFMPDVTDVSSGVELDDGCGKDRNKIKEFVKNARLL
jgi:phosphoribosylanthranilate isomerase